MWFTAITVAVGALIGVALGGRPRYVPEHTFHLWPLLLAGLAMQVVADARSSNSLSVALVVLSYVCLVTFAVLNLRLAGMGVVIVGMLLNLAPIVVNDGMPVRASALVDADIAASAERADAVELRGERHLEESDDHLTVLGDIIPIRVIRQVVSFGDLVLAVGIVTLIVGILRPPKKKQWQPQ